MSRLEWRSSELGEQAWAARQVKSGNNASKESHRKPSQAAKPGISLSFFSFLHFSSQATSHFAFLFFFETCLPLRDILESRLKMRLPLRWRREKEIVRLTTLHLTGLPFGLTLLFVVVVIVNFSCRNCRVCRAFPAKDLSVALTTKLDRLTEDEDSKLSQIADSLLTWTS